MNVKESFVLAAEVGNEILSRLDWMTLQPHDVNVIGYGQEELIAGLKARYANAVVHTKTPLEAIPDQTVDLILANFVLPWQENIKETLREWRRCLRPEGLVMLSTFGPDTLAAFHPVFREEDLPRRIDMHDIGDLLLQEGYADPVLDVDYYTLTYKNRKKLIAELKESHILMPAAAYQEEEITAQEDGTWHAVYEVIYAHAFAPSPQEDLSPSEKGVVRVPLDHVRKQLKLK